LFCGFGSIEHKAKEVVYDPGCTVYIILARLEDGDVSMAKSKKQAQALAIKLSRERRSGKKIPPPPKGRYAEKTRQKAIRDLKIGGQRLKRRTGKKRRVR
jgi:hypothetical protein